MTAKIRISAKQTTDDYVKDLARGLEAFDKPVTVKPKPTITHVTLLRYEVKRLFKEACRYDGIDPDASFVVWSTENPYSGLYNVAMTEYLEAAKDLEMGRPVKLADSINI